MMRPLPKRPYAQLHLPALTAEEALLIAGIFQNAVDAIWRAHGKAMAHFLGDSFPQDERKKPPPADDIPF